MFLSHTLNITLNQFHAVELVHKISFEREVCPGKTGLKTTVMGNKQMLKNFNREMTSSDLQVKISKGPFGGR